MQCSALALISGSTFMMLKGATIVTTLVFSYWFIDFKIRSRHIFGCGLAVVGLAIVGMADIFLSDTKVANDSSVNYWFNLGFADDWLHSDGHFFNIKWLSLRVRTKIAKVIRNKSIAHGWMVRSVWDSIFVDTGNCAFFYSLPIRWK